MRLYKEDPAVDKGCFWGWLSEKSHFLGDIYTANTYWYLFLTISSMTLRLPVKTTKCHALEVCKLLLSWNEARRHIYMQNQAVRYSTELSLDSITLTMPPTPHPTPAKKRILSKLSHWGKKLSSFYPPPWILRVCTFRDKWNDSFFHPSLCSEPWPLFIWWDSICRFLPSKYTCFNLTTACPTPTLCFHPRRGCKPSGCGVTQTLV